MIHGELSNDSGLKNIKRLINPADSALTSRTLTFTHQQQQIYTLTQVA